MRETLEDLKIPISIYRELEKIAQSQGISPSNVVENFVHQFQISDTLQTLRQEYHRLTDKIFSRTITATEERRLACISKEITVLERQTPQGQHWIRWNTKTDEMIERAERLIEQANSELAQQK